MRHGAGNFRPRRPAIAKEVAGVERIVPWLHLHVSPASEQKQAAKSETCPAQNSR
jgi:hypothetical protein